MTGQIVNLKQERGYEAFDLAGLVLVHGPAFAERREAHHPMRRTVRVRPLPAVPPPVLVRDYLPRNLNVPMYNEPPRRAPAW